MTYPIIMPMPIGNSGSGVEYMFPAWVKILLSISIAGVLIGLAGFLIGLALDLALEKDADALFRISLLIVVAGSVLLIMAVPCMLLTGTPVE